ncbi:hypothetical protein AAMO2058_001161400 [Amorphochlora amoebiformis]
MSPWSMGLPAFSPIPLFLLFILPPSSSSPVSPSANFAIVRVETYDLFSAKELIIGMYGDFGPRIDELIEGGGLQGLRATLMAYFRGGGERRESEERGLEGEMVGAEPLDGCGEMKNVRGKFAVVRRGNCSYVEKALNAQTGGASAILILDSLRLDGMTGGDLGKLVEIPTLKLQLGHVGEFVECLPLQATISDYHPPVFDPARIILGAIAIGVVAVGAYVSAGDFRLSSRSDNREIVRYTDSLDPPVAFIESYAWGFVLAACLLLVFLIKFTHIVEYIFLAVFCVVGAQGYFIFLTWVFHIHTTPLRSAMKAWNNNIGQIICVITAVGLAVWGITAYEAWYSWALHDAVGISFLIMLQRNIHLPTLWGSTLLNTLSMLSCSFLILFSPHLFYDSMLAHATVAGPGQRSPMILRIPYLASKFKGLHYAVFGLLDIGIPGFYISNLLQLDLKRNMWVPIWSIPSTDSPKKKRRKYGYFVFGLLGYAVGIVLNEASQVYSCRVQPVQPALIWLVPSVFASVFLVAYSRKDILGLWGEFDDDYNLRREQSRPMLQEAHSDCSDSYESHERKGSFLMLGHSHSQPVFKS